ncbi:hypothetical protein PF005_g17018 [Phytophthora fragariae]|uniref:RxLR effector protein n=1 Tax=Phytophthora fragariae TaxID=53985 RepID=A0A6A3RLN2_9STRA|nr:hypothetical protein PF003_g21213 [Phytophthora fragariae]KAE8931694.1 hypothetical protein PF009_g18255 [Phytophthora fragariae]KAE8996306.1 hypothetical protein PF011_g15965 [Phytophthora fragariae]KAE9095782.1 hypothetical protein PF010_g16583 [Phytophthora fragariae]KAE9096015.1 hypothetical protein PF007_g17170 [Phytophthora fragariae]
MNLLWRIWSTITPAMLWRLRVDAVFKNKNSNEEITQAAIQSAGNHQVQAIINAWKQNPAKRHVGMCMDICQRIMNTAAQQTTPPTIKTWILDIAYGKNSTGKWSGGWVLYAHKHDTTWAAMLKERFFSKEILLLFGH